MVTGKVSAVSEILSKTHVAQLLSALDDNGPVISHLMSKLNTARDMLKQATGTVVATGGN